MPNDYASAVSKFTNIQDYIKHKWDTNYAMTQEQRRDWFNNVAFYEGRQWQHFGADIGGFSNDPAQDETTQRVYAVSNLIQPLADSRIAAILGERPIPEVVSNDKSSPESINRAERETAILKSLWEDMNVQSLLIEAIWWSVICNRVFLRPYFDPEHGKDIKNPKYNEDDAFTAQQMGTEYSEPQTYKTGRLNIDMFEPFDVVYDTVHKPWINVMRYGWVLIKNVESIDDLYSKYDKKKVDKIKPAQGITISTVKDQLLQLRDRGAWQSMMKERKESGENRNVEKFEYYEAPNNTYPDGLHVIICQDVVLYDNRETDEKFKLIPVIRIKDRVHDGKSLVSTSRQKQKIYNVLYSKIIEYSRLPIFYGLPQGVDIDAVQGKAYEMFNFDEDYRSSGSVIQPADPSQVWLMIMDKVEKDVEHQWGSHEVTSRAAPPGKSSSGRQVFLLQQKDVERLGPTMTMLNDSLSDLSEIMLDLFKEHIVLPRTMNYRDGEGIMQSITASGKDISEERKVSVQMTSEYKRNKQAYMEFIIQFMGVLKNVPAVAQILNDPVVMRRLIAYIDEGFANTMIVRNKDMAVQERENRELLAGGTMPKVKPWHKHEVHIRIMLDMMNSDEFMDLDEQKQQRIVGNMGEDKKPADDGHFVNHLYQMQIQMETKMKAQQAMTPQKGQGGPQPGPGGAVFTQGQGPTDPLQAIDRTIEGQVNPMGSPGTEVG